MADMMQFPDTFEEFINEYSFKDTDEVYTNGSELIPVFRLMQGVEYYFHKQNGDMRVDLSSYDEGTEFMEYPKTAEEDKYGSID